MTSLVSWVGVDSRGPASIYIATDSRISWGSGSTWDAGRKVFAGRSRPEVFGYVGDVLFPSLILGQIADAIETPFEIEEPPAEQRFERVTDLLKSAFQSLPSSQRRAFQIVYARRFGEGMKADFRFFSLSWDESTRWKSEEKDPPPRSDSIVIWGSGASSVALWKDRWNNSSQGRTSRAIFSSFCDAVGSAQDPLSGGAPQLVGLYRIGPSRTIGVVHAGKPFVFGLQADPADHVRSGLEWRNRLFERCDASGNRVASAQPHHSPRGLGRSATAVDAAQQQHADGRPLRGRR